MNTPSFKTTLFFACSLMLSACTMGPNFSRPENPPIKWETSTDSAIRSQPVTSRIDPAWWDIFHDATLSSLAQRVAATNLDVQGATSRLLQSRAALNVAGGAALPSLDAKGRYQRQQTTSEGRFDPSGQGGASAFNHWQAGLEASWELDPWGRVAREVEASTATVAAAEDMRRGVLVAVLGETARDYIQLRGIQRQKAITQDNLALALQTIKLTRLRFSHGVATNLEVAEALAHAATVEARLPMLAMQEARLVNALSYLMGEAPHALRAELEQPAAIPQVPDSVPVGLPSELAQRRPDIRRAEAELHVATARIGVAEADFYPRISLTGNVGSEALQLASFGNWSTRYFGIGPALSLPIFDGGRLRGMLSLRENQQKEAAIRYQQVVLKAWHEVDDAMTEYGANQLQDSRLAEALLQTENALASARKQYLAGAVDFLHVLVVQKELLSTQEAAVQSRMGVDLALIGLYRSLGGGWEKQYPQ